MKCNVCGEIFNKVCSNCKITLDEQKKHVKKEEKPAEKPQKGPTIEKSNTK
jgi:hypothetical protein